MPLSIDSILKVFVPVISGALGSVPVMFNEVFQCHKFIVLCSNCPNVNYQFITKTRIIILKVNVEDVFW